MQNETISNTSLWKKFERFSVIIVVLSGIAGLIGLYYQVYSKKNEIQFQVISKDYLTSNNNIDRLKSNYLYAGIPVRNLWLLKLKIINTGDITLIGKGTNESILDSSIVFKFPNNIQILDKPNLIQNNFPDHQLIRTDSNRLSLSFQQWRKSEFAIYSIYIKSDKKDVSLLPSSKRIIKDGNILIEDLTNDQAKNKQPLLDILLSSPWTFICRATGILLATIILLFVIYGMTIESIGWYKIVRWRIKHYKNLKAILNSKAFLTTETNFNNYFKKEDFLTKQSIYIKDPTKISASAPVWKNYGIETVPYNNQGTTTTWRVYYVLLFMLFFTIISTLSVIMGLWLH